MRKIFIFLFFVFFLKFQILAQVSRSSPYTYMTYTSDNFGIGTVSPLSKLDVRGHLTLDAGQNPGIFVSTSSTEQNRFLQLLNSPLYSSSASLKTSGLLVSTVYSYNSPKKGELLVEKKLAIGFNSYDQYNQYVNGIPTSASALTINGDVNFTGNLYKNGVLFSASDWLKNGTNLYYSTGNVGVGTANPSYKLDISGDINFTGNIYKNGTLFSTGSSSDWSKTGTNLYYTSGNVGVGTATPTYKLDITGDINFTGSLYNNGVPFTPGGSGSDWLKNGTNLYYNAGNVGLGTTSPTEKLEINGRLKMNDNIILNGNRITSDGSNNGSLLINPATGLVSINKDAPSYSGYKFAVYGDSYFNNKVAIYHDPSPTLKASLYVAATSIANGYYAIYSDGESFSNVAWSGSDKRFKKNIKTIDNALDKVCQLRGTTYEYRVDEFKDKNFKQGTNYGVIAQEIQAVLPELVQSCDSNYLAVNYNGLIPVLIESIKTQQLIIKAQQQNIEDINKKYEELSKKVEKLLKDTAKIHLKSVTDNQNSSQKSPAILYQNKPNPFNNQTTIEYYLPTETKTAVIKVYDSNGKQIALYNLTSSEGFGSIDIDRANLNQGIYFYSLYVNDLLIATKSMVSF